MVKHVEDKFLWVDGWMRGTMNGRVGSNDKSLFRSNERKARRRCINATAIAVRIEMTYQ
jgi:hypothetical protein